MIDNERKQSLDEVGEEVFVKRTVQSPPVQSSISGMVERRSVNTSGRKIEHVSGVNKELPRQAAIDKKSSDQRINAEKKGSSSRFSSALNKIKIFSKSKEGNLQYKEHRYFEIARKTMAMIFAVVALSAVIACTVLGYSYSGDSIRMISQMGESYRSDAKNYRIVYSESDPWGASVATELRGLFSEKTGAVLKIVTDKEPLSRHEIRVGYTNRAGDDYLTSVSALGTDGYAILLTSGDNVNITAFSEEGAKAAVKYFVSSYVGSYMNGNMTFANKMNLSFVSRSGNEPGTSLRDSKITLNFSDNGDFRVLVLSDADINTNTVAAIAAISEKEKPDLVIFAGDVSSGMTTKAELETYLKTLTSPLESKKIPWSAVFGEQDTDGGLSAEAQMEVYSSFQYCVAKSDFSKNGTVSHFIPVFAYGEGDSSSAPVTGIFAMGQTPMLSNLGSGITGDSVLSEDRQNGTDYGYVNAEQISWFLESQKLLDREAGGSMPTVMVTHTPVPELAVIAANPEKTGLYGNIGESVSSSPINSGLFSALIGAKNVLGLYSGHDHLNSFSGVYCGIELGNCASIGYDGYGFGGTFDINNSLRGGRLIEFKLEDGKVSVTSRMLYASSYISGIN
ncbi:MAG: metallophosphoesterase [Clostridia bacterium]|nr:metallophosphoesterase [Clostridia bacterium]